MLHSQLQAIVHRDPEQEVRGMAVPVLDAAIEMAKSALGDHPVVATVAGLYDADAIGEGEPVRAVDLMLVVGQLQAALPPFRR
jgi:hypothetical protein